eukprot:525938_1
MDYMQEPSNIMKSELDCDTSLQSPDASAINVNMSHLDGGFRCQSCYQLFGLKLDLIRHVTSTHSGQESELLGSGGAIKPDVSTIHVVKQEPSISPGGQVPELRESNDTIKREQFISLSDLQPGFPGPGNFLNPEQTSTQSTFADSSPGRKSAELSIESDISVLGCDIKFACPECPQVCYDGRTLRSHFTKIHSQKPTLSDVLCNECGIICQTVSDLQ